MSGRLLIASILAAALAATPLSMMPSSVQAADAPLGCGESEVVHELANGAAWRMCARIHTYKGLVLESVEFRPASAPTNDSRFIRIIDEIYLSQLNVPYDTGYAQYNDITSFGFGGQHLLPQNEAVCEGETILVEQAFTYGNQLVERSIPGICLIETRTGITTHSNESEQGTGRQVTAQGRALEISSLSKIAWYEYQQKLTFDDQGGIDVGLGATGDLPNGDPGSSFWATTPSTGWPLGGATTHNGLATYASSHWHSAIWKVDFGIDQQSAQFVERWDYSVSPGQYDVPVTSGTPTREETPFSSVPAEDHDALTWWRVGSDGSQNPDGHPRSYEIVNSNPANTAIPVTAPLITVTNANACHEYASHNLNTDCGGIGILDYVQDSTPLTDPVAWINVGFHHIVRDEDQSPMPIHWQRFQLQPRDFLAQSPSLTEERMCINGPSGTIDSVNRPCKAVNVSRPRISPTTATPGTELTTSNGLWNTARTTWDYGYMWFRDGEPIVEEVEGQPTPATSRTYTVTEEDAGHEITVKVYAHKPGFMTGVSTSSALRIPGGAPTPSPTISSPTPRPTATSKAPAKAAKSQVSLSFKRTKSIRSGGRAVLTIRATSVGAGTPSGRVTVSRGSIKKTGTLSKGRVTIRLPRIKKRSTYRFTVTYAGSNKFKSSKSTFTLRVKKR